jgi:hypothetical protein
MGTESVASFGRGTYPEDIPAGFLAAGPMADPLLGGRA